MKEATTIFGIRAVIEAIESGESIDKIFIQKGLSGELFSELKRTLSKGNYNISYVPQEKLYKLSKGNHQGVVAKISPIAFKGLEETVEPILAKKEVPFFLLLDQINDVRNFGAIIRTAECCGVDAIIIPDMNIALITPERIANNPPSNVNITVVIQPRPFE